MTTSDDGRAWFARLTAGVLELVAQVPPDAADRPGLGNWTLAELAAHTLRAWTTLTTYLGEPAPEDRTPLTAAGYLVAGLTLKGVHAGVEERARQDAIAIGDGLQDAARLAAEAALRALAGADDDRLVATRFGAMTAVDFVRTRNLELVVHGLDLACALDLDPPPVLLEGTVPVMALLAEVAVARGKALPILAAVTGRAPLPPGFTLME